MTREIKFRGKRSENYRGTAEAPAGKGEWVYGSLLHDPRDDTYHIFDEQSMFWVRVAPATVGQFTGRKDKNGREIYEGDILRIPEMPYFKGGNGYVLTIDDHFAMKYGNESEFEWRLAWVAEESDDGILGNIHDNPELLKK